ncbi:MAG: LicD family protein [Oribacterium sp.]|nr:LicD family protein [Oribacterium sp.]
MAEDRSFEFDLSKVHRANLEILEAIDRICRAHQITYRLDAGTLLGAVRHGGFIPWDDDVDLVFRREEFEKFAAIADQELPDKMELIHPTDYQHGRAFFDFVPRVIYKNSRRHAADDADQSFYEGKLNHLWVDLFIIDRLPDSPIGERICKLRQQIVFGLGMGHRREVNFRQYHGLQKLEVMVLATAGRCLSMPFLFRLQDRWARKYTDRVRKTGHMTKRSYFSNYQPDFQYCTVENSWEEPVRDISFEGRTFYGPQDTDKVLTMLYHNYWQLPPEEKRVPSHSGREIEVLD